jgi:hypothetical protein
MGFSLYLLGAPLFFPNLRFSIFLNLSVQFFILVNRSFCGESYSSFWLALPWSRDFIAGMRAPLALP